MQPTCLLVLSESGFLCAEGFERSKQAKALGESSCVIAGRRILVAESSAGQREESSAPPNWCKEKDQGGRVDQTDRPWLLLSGLASDGNFLLMEIEVGA